MSALRELILKSPDPMDAVLKMGTAVGQCGMFGASTAQQGVVIVLHCMEKGMPLLDWQARYHLIGESTNKKPSMKAEAMLAAFEESGGVFRWLNDGTSGDYAEIELETEQGTKQVVRYTMQQAKSAGLVKPGGGWTKNPDAMLRARVVSAGLRMVSPSIVVGVYTPEEIEDINTEEVAGITSLTIRAEQATPPTAGEQSTDGKKKPGRPPGSGMKKSEPAAVVAGDPATPQPATEPQATAAATAPAPAAPPVKAEQAKPTAEPAPKPQQAPQEQPQLPDVSPVDPKAIDTPKLQYERLMSKVARVREIWGEKAAVNWAKVEQGLSIEPGSPIPQEHWEYLEGWCDTRIKKHEAEQQGKTLESWANQAVAAK